MTKDNAKKCTHCSSCLTCEVLRIADKLEKANNRFIEIHSTTSDVIMSHQLMLNCCRENQALFHEFNQIISKLRLN
jgi:hypothetical protein